MNKSEAQHIIDEVVSRVQAIFEPRFDQIDVRFDRLEEDIKGLKRRMLTLEEAVEDMRLEQKMIRMAAITNFSDIERIKDRLGLTT